MHSTADPFPKPSNIQLAWPSAPVNKVEKFRNDFWENARRVFFHHLLPCPSRLCPIGPHYDGLSDTRNPSKLIEIFQEIDFDKLVDGYAFPDVPYRFIAFLDWVVQEVSIICSFNLGCHRQLFCITGKPPSKRTCAISENSKSRIRLDPVRCTGL